MFYNHDLYIALTLPILFGWQHVCPCTVCILQLLYLLESYLTFPLTIIKQLLILRLPLAPPVCMVNL